jgi:hypothetical protein
LVVAKYTVTVQVTKDWPAKAYSFRDRAQALMFEASCKRDRYLGERYHRVEVSA